MTKLIPRPVDLTDSQALALRWLKCHNGDGGFDKNGVLIAAGEKAPFMRSTWNVLAQRGLVEIYDKKRLRVLHL